jgi:hypothetical protein
MTNGMSMSAQIVGRLRELIRLISKIQLQARRNFGFSRSTAAPRNCWPSLKPTAFFQFDWSGDGKYLACVRGLWATKVVLIKDFSFPGVDGL